MASGFSLPQIPGIGAPAALPGALPGALPANPAASMMPATQIPNIVQQFVSGGIQAPKIALTALTLFPTTGIAGLNHQAIGNPIGMLLKVVSYGAGILWGLQFNKVYPGILGTIISALMFVGPWYIFDALQILFGPYETEGFVPPVPLEGFPTPKPAPDGSWLFTPITLSIILATLPAGAYGLSGILKYYMPGLDISNIQKYSGYATAGATGLGAVLSVFAATRTPAAPAPMRGGGLPPLSHFVKRLQSSQTLKARNDSLTFLGILGIVVLGGFSMAYARSSKVAA